MAQIERCQVCGKKALRSKLVRKLMPFALPAGENQLLYSSYSSAFWTVDTSTEVGYVSMGLFADRYRPRVSADGTAVEARGSYTVQSSGTFRSSVATDVSDLTDICFSVHVGAYHGQTVQALTVVLGLCDDSGTNATATKSWSVKGGKKVWFTLPVADIPSPLAASGIYVYGAVTITGAVDWWFDGAQLQDSKKPSNYLPITSGAASVTTGNTWHWKVPILCSDHANERLLKPSENLGEFRVPEFVEIKSRIESL